MPKIRRTLIVGLGECGARICDRFRRELDALTGGLPAIRCLVVRLPEDRAAPEQVELSRQLYTELRQAHRLAYDRQCAERGWPVSAGPGVSLVVVADLGDPVSAAHYIEIAQLAREVSLRRARSGVSLCGIALLPDVTGDPADEPRLAAAGKALHTLERAQRVDAEPYSIFDDGCYLLSVDNEAGLAADDMEAREEMVANWLIQVLLTPLGLALERHALPGGNTGLGSFGLARWSFPADELAAHLAARLQVAMLDVLLAPDGLAPDAEAAGGAFVCPTPPAWDALPSLTLAPQHFLPPELKRIEHLRDDVDRAVETARTRLALLIEDRDAALQEAEQTAVAALRAGVAARLDAPGATPAEAAAFARDAARAAHAQADHAAQEADAARARLERLDEALAEAGAALDRMLDAFPAQREGIWARLLCEPRRALRLALVYRALGERLTAYLGIHQARWTLHGAAIQADGQAYFDRHVGEAADELAERVEEMEGRLGVLRDRRANSPLLDETAVDATLEANALPRGLAGFYYRSLCRPAPDTPQGDLHALLAVYGPLSRWLDEERSLADLETLFDEYATERVSFLHEVRLDELLVRSYTGHELKARLRLLVGAARPFWNGDEATLSAKERESAALCAYVGLPQPGTSMLNDLLSEIRPDLGLYADPHPQRITAVQVRRGLPLRALWNCEPALTQTAGVQAALSFK